MKKKRIISFLLTLVMVVSLFPTAAFAKEPSLAYITIKDDGIHDSSGTKWDAYYGLTFTPATASTPATLTMENCSMEQGPYDQAWTAIRSEITEPLKLLVKGDNALTIDNAPANTTLLEREKRSVAIEAAGDLEIVFDNDANLTITGACNGIVANGDITIQDKANITMNLMGCNSTGITVLADNCLTVNGANTYLDISTACHGIFARVDYEEGAVVINDGTINLSAITPPEYDNNWDGGIAIEANDITITGGNVTSVTKGVDSHDFYAENNFTVTGGTVTLGNENGNNALVWNATSLGSMTKPATIENAEEATVACGLLKNTWGLSALDETKPVVIKFVELPSYTVTFEANGGSPAPANQKSYGIVAEPEAMTKADSVFAGWYKDAKCIQRFDFSEDIISSDITLYAKWVESKADLAGVVYWVDGGIPEGATVELYSGAQMLASTTVDSNGLFTFEDVPTGEYRIIACKYYYYGNYGYLASNTANAAVRYDGTAEIETTEFSLDNKPVIFLYRNSDHISTIITIVKGAPEITVKEFNKAAFRHKESGKIVEVELTIESKDASAVNDDERTTIEEEAATIIQPSRLHLDYLDMYIKKTVTPVDKGPSKKETIDIHDTVDVLTINIPYDTEDKEDISVLRYHNSEATVFSETPDANGEYVEILPNLIVVHARYFSTYAIGYAADTPLIPIDVPTAITGLIYNGSEQTGVPEGTGYKITGNKETNAGDSYKATATLESGYIWKDETSTPKDIPWAIGKATLEQPTIRSKVYNGQLQKADIDPAGLPYTVTLNDGGIEAGSYPVELTITSQNYQWAGLNSPLCNLTFIITGAPSYTVRAYADNGNRVDADKTANVLKGETVKITVTPADGYVCEGYTVKTETTNALVPVTNNAFTMPEDNVYITAVFTKNEAYVVNGYADAMGNKVTPDINKAEAGTKITLKVFTADKYSLKSLNVKTVSGASVTLASDNTFTMPAADVVVNALFEKQKDDPIIIIIPRLTPTPEPTKTPEPTDAPKPTEAPEPTKEPEVTVYPTEEDFLLNSIRLNKKYKVTQPEDIIDIKWGKVKDADGYLVYAEYCGTSFKQVARLTDNEILTYSLDCLNGEPINQADEFKIMVKAYKVIDGQDVIIGKSIHAHIAGSDSVKYTNANGIKVTSPTKPVLSIGETSSITATVLLEDKSKKPLSNNHARELRFMSANPNVAVVADDGTITAVGAGKCNIYVYARNGFAKKITVTVK